MKVKFLREHIDNKTGDIADLPEGRANYLIRAGVVEIYEEKKPKKKK